MNIEQIARVAHNVNTAYDEASGSAVHPRWEDCTDEHRASMIRGVEFVLSNPDATPQASHEAWMEQKQSDGWSHGVTPDLENKVSPAFAPYDQVPERYRVKDYLFQAVVRSLVMVQTDASGVKTAHVTPDA